MNENSFPVQLSMIVATWLPTIYLAIIHVNILETIIAYLIIILASLTVFKKWYIVLNMASFLVVLMLIISIGGTL